MKHQDVVLLVVETVTGAKSSSSTAYLLICPQGCKIWKKKNHIAIILKDIVNALQLTQFSFYFNAVLSPVSPLSRKGSMILI